MKINVLEGHRYFIWAIVAIIIVLGALIAYIQISSINNEDNWIPVKHVPKLSNNIPGNPSPTPNGTNSQPINNPQCTSGKSLSATECIKNLSTGLIRYTNSNYNFSFEYPNKFIYGSNNTTAKFIHFSLIGKPVIDVSVTKELMDQFESSFSYRANGVSAHEILGTHNVDVFNDHSDIGADYVDFVFYYKNFTFDFGAESQDQSTKDLISNIISSLK